MLAYGTPVELSGISSREFYVPVHKDGGFLGVLRVVLTGIEIAVSFIPGIGIATSAGIGLAFAGAQAAITVESYAEGNIRSTGQLFGALAIDILPAGVFGASTAARALRTEAIVVETIDEALQTTRVNRVYARKTTEFKENLKVLKSQGVRSVSKVNKLDGSITKTSKLRASEITKYRQAFIKEQARLGRETAGITFDDFEVRMQDALRNATNKDLALVRNIKYSKNLLANDPDRYMGLIETISGELSPRLQAYIKNQGKDPTHVLDGLIDYTNSRKLTSTINRIFASGESDWASKEFWQQVKNGKILKSSNFYTQAAQALNANDVGREIITKPFNALIRKNKEFVEAYRKKWIKRWTAKYGKKGIFTAIEKEEKLRRDMKKFGRYWGESFVLGYRIIQDLGKTKMIQIHFNKFNTNARRAGSKNHGGKKDIIMPMTDYQLKKWNHSANKSSYYLSHFALSRGGKAIGYSVESEVFANFLSFVPLPALRNVLSVVSNFKQVGKDIRKGTYVKEWFTDFEKTVKRLWVHKVGKLGGSFLGVFGHGAGKEGQRIGLGIAKGFQHKGGQSLGKFNPRSLLKETLPQGFRGSVLRKGRKRIRSGQARTASQAKLSSGRYLTNIRRIGGIGR